MHVEGWRGRGERFVHVEGWSRRGTNPANNFYYSHIHINTHTHTLTAQGGGEYETLEEAKEALPCGIRIGDQIREWEEGKCLVFDDSYEHEVWNKTGEERVLLLVDFWHVCVEGCVCE